MVQWNNRLWVFSPTLCLSISILAFRCRQGLPGFICSPPTIRISFPTSCDPFSEASLWHRVSISYLCRLKTSAGWNLIQTFWPVWCPVFITPVQSWGSEPQLFLYHFVMWKYRCFEFLHHFLCVHKLCMKIKLKVASSCFFLSFIVSLLFSFWHCVPNAECRMINTDIQMGWEQKTITRTELLRTSGRESGEALRLFVKIWEKNKNPFTSAIGKKSVKNQLGRPIRPPT